MKMDDVPDGSLYFWCYTQGLKHINIMRVTQAVANAGKQLRKKDIDNFWNGWYRSDLYMSGENSIWEIGARNTKPGLQQLADYEFVPTEYNNWSVGPENRWIPCNADNKPMIKWGNGCMTMADACAYPGQVYLAENNKGCNRIIIDCDGDHGNGLDIETILFLSKYIDQTNTLYKDVLVSDVEGYERTGISVPISFHLAFRVKRIIPTMHFPKAHIDIIGNKVNSLRYIKTKSWNNKPVIDLTYTAWNEIREFIERRQ